MGVKTPSYRRSQRLTMALAELGQAEPSGRLAALTPPADLLSPHNPPQRPFVTDLRLSPAQRSRQCYSPHWLQTVEAPGCGLVLDETLTISGFGQPIPLSPPRSRPATCPESMRPVSRQIQEETIRVNMGANKALKSAQTRSKVFYERQPISMRSTHNHQAYVPMDERPSTSPQKLRYKERLLKYHAFDGRLINSRVLMKED